MASRIGIYSGTFDPLHVGHMAFAKESIRLCNLNKVFFLPERHPRNKPNVSQLSTRISLIKQATVNDSVLDLFQVTSHRFTINETLPEIQRAFKGDSLTFLIGSDVIKTMHSWPNLGIVLPHIHFAIGMRHTESQQEIKAAIQYIEKKHQLPLTYTLVQTPHADISSTAIRTMSTTA